FSVERCASSVRRPQTFAFPARLWIVNAAVKPLCVETERVRNCQDHPLSVLQREQSSPFVTGRDGRVLTKSESVELVDPGVIARFSTPEILGTLNWRTRHRMKRPTLGTILAGCIGTIQRILAFTEINNGQ